LPGWHWAKLPAMAKPLAMGRLPGMARQLQKE
jgi:hypothetical protein